MWVSVRVRATERERENLSVTVTVLQLANEGPAQVRTRARAGSCTHLADRVGRAVIGALWCEDHWVGRVVCERVVRTLKSPSLESLELLAVDCTE